MLQATSDHYLGDLTKLKFVVVDETDRMIEKGHFEELDNILNVVREQAPSKRQTLLFSATLTYVHPAPRRLQKQQEQNVTVKEKLGEQNCFETLLYNIFCRTYC